jgi:hypothetical protein
VSELTGLTGMPVVAHFSLVSFYVLGEWPSFWDFYFYFYLFFWNSNVTVAPWNNQASDTSTFDRLRDTCNKMFLRDGHLRGSSQFALSPTLPRVSPTSHFRFSSESFFVCFVLFCCFVLLFVIPYLSGKNPELIALNIRLP